MDKNFYGSTLREEHRRMVMSKVLLAFDNPSSAEAFACWKSVGLAVKGVTEDGSVVILELDKKKLNAMDVDIVLHRLSNFGEVVHGH
jgi:hypothetical protein